MTPEQIKAKVINAWLAQMEKYANGPAVGASYCSADSCYMCISLTCKECPLHNVNCERYKTYKILRQNIFRCCESAFALVEKITPKLTAAMSLRHEFYVRGYNEVLRDAPPERFVSGEGFPELLEIDRELAEGVKQWENT